MSALAASAPAADRLELEITETALLHDSEATLAMLYRLRELGVRIAMDDFGTGYSSLSLPAELSLRRIKIDRSFIKDIADGVGSLNIVRAVAALAKGLGMETTAEGRGNQRAARHCQVGGLYRDAGLPVQPSAARPRDRAALLPNRLEELEAKARAIRPAASLTTGHRLGIHRGDPGNDRPTLWARASKASHCRRVKHCPSCFTGLAKSLPSPSNLAQSIQPNCSLVISCTSTNNR